MERMCGTCGEPTYLYEDPVDVLVFGEGQDRWLHEGTQEEQCAR